MLRRFSTTLLILTLLLSGSVGALGHGHALESQTNSACFVDHDASHNCDPCADAHFDGAGSRHEHVCVACHFARERGLELAQVEMGGGLGRSGSIACAEEPYAGQLLQWTQSARGPPSSQLLYPRLERA